MFHRTLRLPIIRRSKPTTTATAICLVLAAQHIHTSRACATGRTRGGFSRSKKERYEDTVHPPQASYAHDDSQTPPWVLGKLRLLRLAINDGNFEETLARLRKKRARFDHRTFVELLDGIPDVATFKRVERALGIPSNYYIRNKFFELLRKKHSLSGLMERYAEAKHEELVQDWPVVLPLLYALRDAAISSGDDEIIDTCVRVYNDAKMLDKSREKENLPSQATDRDLYRYFTKAFHIVFNVVAKARSKKGYLPMAQKLSLEAQDMGYKIDSGVASTLAVELMRGASSYEDALRIYRKSRANFPMFDAHAYKKFFLAYCNLEFIDSKTAIPPIHGCLEILGNIEEEGLPLEEFHYSVLLTLFCKVADTINELPDPSIRVTRQKSLVEVADRMYNHLLVETSVKPGRMLWTQFMDVYARLRNFDGVAKMWNFIDAGATVNNITVSVLFDACGFTGAYDLALQVKSKLDKEGFVMNRNNWASWLECLCRVGKLDDAVQQFLDESPRDADGLQDRLGAVVILGFARRDRRLEEIRTQIRSRAPALFEAHPSDGYLARRLLAIKAETVEQGGMTEQVERVEQVEKNVQDERTKRAEMVTWIGKWIYNNYDKRRLASK